MAKFGSAWFVCVSTTPVRMSKQSSISFKCPVLIELIIGIISNNQSANVLTIRKISIDKGLKFKILGTQDG